MMKFKTETYEPLELSFSMNSLIATIALLATGLIAHAEVGPTVGAIRWDAWTGGNITKQVERSLGPEKYHTRLTWFAEVLDGKTVRIDGSPQEVMDREIDWAARAGLDYWVFLTYPKNSELSSALGQYLSRSKRDQINFCLILHSALTLPEEQWKKERDRSLGLLREPGYQNVLGDRPLVYAFTGADFPFERFADFLNEARKQGHRPYCVFMGWNPAAEIKEAKSWGFDAVSSYAKGGSQANFSDLAKATEKDLWDNASPAPPRPRTSSSPTPRMPTWHSASPHPARNGDLAATAITSRKVAGKPCRNTANRSAKSSPRTSWTSCCSPPPT
jgi:hypothetical protein